MKKILSIMALASITGCIASPEVARKTGYESQMTCQQIAQEIERTNQLKKDSRKDDRFMFRYINPISGFLSIYTMNKAESAAEKKLIYLEKLNSSKQCSTQLYAGNNGYGYQQAAYPAGQNWAYQSPYNGPGSAQNHAPGLTPPSPGAYQTHYPSQQHPQQAYGQAGHYNAYAAPQAAQHSYGMPPQYPGGPQQIGYGTPGMNGHGPAAGFMPSMPPTMGGDPMMGMGNDPMMGGMGDPMMGGMGDPMMGGMGDPMGMMPMLEEYGPDMQNM